MTAIPAPFDAALAEARTVEFELRAVAPIARKLVRGKMLSRQQQTQVCAALVRAVGKLTRSHIKLEDALAGCADPGGPAA